MLSRFAAFAVLLTLNGVVQADTKNFNVNLDQRVQIVLGYGGTGDFSSRLQAVHGLSKHADMVDAEALFEGIVLPSHAQGLAAAQWAALYNEVLNLLNNLKTPLPNYTERLLELLAEDSRDGVLRDYALQHLLAYAEFHLKADESRQELLEETAAIALAATEITLPGTYLLGIYQMAGKPGYPDAGKIAKTAIEIAMDSEAFVPNRISALQICAQLNHAPALGIARALAEDVDALIALRTSAVAAIGLLGDSEIDRKLLVRLKRWGSNSRLQHAADAALKRLQI